MKKSLLTAAAVALVLVAGGEPLKAVLAESSTDSSQLTEGGLGIEGVMAHYHTGDEVTLVATGEQPTDGTDYQWYIQKEEDSEWTALDGFTTQIFSREATDKGFQVKVAVLDQVGTVVSESGPVEILIDNHGVDDYVGKRIYEGFFFNNEIGQRDLTDFAGDWQSVYPYLLDGELDEVMEHKAESSTDMTKEDFIEKYTGAYETDVAHIAITEDSFTFTYADGTVKAAKYASEGYEILNKDNGNRAVRHVFKRSDDVTDMPTYMIFSDHNIAPAKAAHFHLYFGEDRDALLNESSHFPTYYPAAYNGEEIVHDMLAH